MKYLSNFQSLEFGGKFHDHGEEIKVRKGEEGAIDVLVREGRVTAVGDSDEPVPAGSETEAPAPADPLDHDNNGRRGGSKAGDEATARKR